MKRTPLQRKTRLKSRGRQRFPDRRDYEYLKWAKNHPCAVRNGECLGEVACHHLKTRGAGGYDRENVIPLCAAHHTEIHAKGIFTFDKTHRCDSRRLARELTRVYDEQK